MNPIIFHITAVLLGIILFFIGLRLGETKQ